MVYCLASRSALQWWFRYGRNRVEEKRVALPIETSTGYGEKPDAFLFELSYKGKLHLFTHQSQARQKIPDTVFHTSSFVGNKKLFVQVGGNVYVCAPELALAQALRSTDAIESIRLACTSFATFDPYDPHVGKLPPLSNKRKLQAACESMPYACSARTKHAVLCHSVENAASPREIDAYMLLCLPTSLGGYGLPKPTLNAAITLNGATAAKSGVTSLHGDMVWRKQKVIVEYDSSEYHGNVTQLQVDSRRRAIMAELGYSVYTLTNNQLTYKQETERFAKILASSLGFRLRIRHSNFEKNNAILRNALL